MKIDFYILETGSRQQAGIFACRLLEKCHAEHNLPVFVHTDTREEAESFDNLLWTYRDDSFLPHELYTDNHQAPIQIGHGGPPPCQQAVLLNLAKDIPAFYRQCNQVIEIVFTDPLVQQLARARYKQYRDLGLEINTIK